MGETFNSIKQGLTEAIEYGKGKPGKAIVYEFTPVDVKATSITIPRFKGSFRSSRHGGFGQFL